MDCGGGRRRWTAIADGLRQTGQLSAPIGRPWRTAPAAGGRPPLPAVGGRSAPSVRRSRRPTASPSADGRPPRRTSVGSSNASGRPVDAAVDVRTRDNPANNKSKTLPWPMQALKATMEQHMGGDLVYLLERA
jgi:hypothetical protein